MHDELTDFKFVGIFATEQERDSFVASMPKSFKADVFTQHGGEAGLQFGFQVSAYLMPTKNNTKNETGIKRFRKFVELYAEHIDVSVFSSNVKSLEEAIMRVDALDN